MFPGMVLDRPAYADLMREVLRHEFPFPWCHHMRILLRDDPVDPVLFKRMEKEPRIAWYTPDLSPQAMEKAMEEEAADESIPLDERCQALLQTAATDYSHKRYPQALEKYQLLFDYYAAQGNHALAALALNGMGEVHRTTGDKKIAGACFEAAMVPATEGQLPHVAVMLPVAFNLATLRAEEKRWEDAEGYWDCLQQLATAQRSPELKVQALEERGHAQYQQGKVPEALATWTATATLAEKLKKPELAKGVLERLRAHYQKVHDSARLREVDRQLSAARQPAPNA
jgi:tetratricopeptide (TPR) repeat protein